MKMSPPTPGSGRFRFPISEEDIPHIAADEDFDEAVLKLKHYISNAIDTAYSYEQLRTTVVGHSLRPLVQQLSDDCHYPAIVAALL